MAFTTGMELSNGAGNVVFAEHQNHQFMAYRGNYVIGTGLAVSEDGTPDLTVAISDGECFNNDTHRSLTSIANVDLSTPHGTLTAGQSLYALIYVDSAGSVTFVAGSAATTGSQQPPDIPEDGVGLALVILTNGDSTIDNADIEDWRILYEQYTIHDKIYIQNTGAGSDPIFNSNDASQVLDLTGTLDISGSLNVAGALDVIGVITTASWNGDVIASAYLDADTMHLGVAQTITANKTFDASSVLYFANGTTYKVDGSGNATFNAIVGGSLSLTTDLAVTHGGTGASSASAARTNLGLIIGTNVQAWDAALDDFAGLTQATDKLPYFSSASAMTTTTFTSFARTLLDDSSASAARSTLQLGSSNAVTFEELSITASGTSAIINLDTTGAGDTSIIFKNNGSQIWQMFNDNFYSSATSGRQDNVFRIEHIDGDDALTLIAGGIGATNPIWGLNTSAPHASSVLDVNGAIYISGTLHASSDRRLKYNDKPLYKATNVLNALNPVSFKWKDIDMIYDDVVLPHRKEIEAQYGVSYDALKSKDRKELSTDMQLVLGKFEKFNDLLKSTRHEGINYGLIAQEVEDILPEIVIEHSETGIKTINYEAITMWLIKGFQELYSMISSS